MKMNNITQIRIKSVVSRTSIECSLLGALSANKSGDLEIYDYFNIWYTLTFYVILAIDRKKSIKKEYATNKEASVNVWTKIGR